MLAKQCLHHPVYSSQWRRQNIFWQQQSVSSVLLPLLTALISFTPLSNIFASKTRLQRLNHVAECHHLLALRSYHHQCRLCRIFFTYVYTNMSPTSSGSNPLAPSHHLGPVRRLEKVHCIELLHTLCIGCSDFYFKKKFHGFSPIGSWIRSSWTEKSVKKFNWPSHPLRKFLPSFYIRLFKGQIQLLISQNRMNQF